MLYLQKVTTSSGQLKIKKSDSIAYKNILRPFTIDNTDALLMVISHLLYLKN